MTVVLDCGIWISAFQFGGTPLAAIDRAFLYDEIATCLEISKEISTILVNKFGWRDSDVRSILQAYLKNAKYVGIQGSLVGVSRDRKDDMLFECAVRARAGIIISGDKDVLIVGEYEGIRVLSARQYIEL